jgi:hypothetical protein
MNNKCPNCNAEVMSENSFCAKCGQDLRIQTPSEISKVEQEISATAQSNDQVANAKDDFKTPFIMSLGFTAVSLFIWSYVYTNWNFNQEVFINRLINNSFWLLLAPYLISFAFKKPKRANAYFNIVLLFIGIGVILLFLGYTQTRYDQDSTTVRIGLKQPCIDNVIKQMDKYNISSEIKNLRATKYCDCLLNKIGDTDMESIGKGGKEFWKVIKENYKDENRDCVEVSLQNK